MRPTARHSHAYAHCPHCHTALRGGTVKRTREVIEWVPARVTVTAHRYLERRGPGCRGRWRPGPEREGVVVGQRRWGSGLLRLLATLREEVRLPIRGIPWYLAAVHGRALSVGAIVEARRTVAARAEAAVTGIREGIRARPVLPVEETGWRQDGRHGYAWTVATPTARLFVHGGRDRAVLEGAIGEDYAGVLVSDFSAVSTGYAGRHPYCWAHLLRDVDDLVGQHPADGTGRGGADAVHALSQRATAQRATATAAAPDPNPAVRRRQRQAFEAELQTLAAPFLGVADAPQRVLCERISKHLAELFVFVAEPAVPATTTAARSLRPLVTCRKIRGGTRSPAGTATKMPRAALFGTWRQQGLDPLAACRALLASPQL